jgi:hypothetical protein
LKAEFGLRPIGAYAYAPVGMRNAECGRGKKLKAKKSSKRIKLKAESSKLKRT